MRVEVEQSGNRVTVLAGKQTLSYEVEGVTLPELSDFSFAGWAMLPWAMLTGEDLEIDGPVDAGAMANINKFSRAWELWQPDRFRMVKASGVGTSSITLDREDAFVFYSGGLDSTDMLLQRGRCKSRMAAVTVHGFDYAPSAAAQFDGLRQMMAPLLEELNYKHIVLRVSEMQGGDHSWALQLAGAAFLLSGLYREGFFASDYTWEQDMISFPWGLNHVTNRYLSGRNFSLSPQCEERTRVEKAEVVGRHPVAIKATSFCKRRDTRPHNCGRCSKCMRTKLMFEATLGRQPDIFLDASFDAGLVRRIDLSSKNERAFFIDLYQAARDRGTIEAIPGLQERFEKMSRGSMQGRRRLSSFFRRFSSSLGRS
ncbi:hypothetical protein FAZ78_11460 [Cereibacter changlensis]|uniref:Uncharacterized protein n=1 Tax=Cereibacter changlensis TaxID=402884 RepID=A0A4U0Z1T7_9RHOB|nr:hypothetical protein [Cereibacter changlensis]TKA96434.1 hypothetical protein FAZ78_11460 [Cereibacter changlensis]